MKRSRFFLISIISILILLASFGVFYLFSAANISEQVVKIPKGATAKSISQILYENGVIKSRTLFRFYTRYQNFEKNLSFGKYLFKGKYTIADVIKTLKKGSVDLTRVTIKEGLMLEEALSVIAKSTSSDYETLVKLAYDKDFVKQITHFSLPSLEGFIYPETYHFGKEFGEREILTAIVDFFYSQVALLNFGKQKKLSFYEVLTLASIVEKETTLESEKPIVASVYLNRIDIGQKLQADPTIIYLLRKMGIKRKRVFYKDLKRSSPYNTYLNKGLPPTPIASPRVSSISAVLTPATTRFFFFVAAGDGSHIFAKTFAEHRKNIKSR